MLWESLFGFPIDLQPYVRGIETETETLRLAFESHQRARRRIDELLVVKKQAVTSYELAFVRIARQFEDLCRLVGQKELAKKVRPSLTRRGETIERSEIDPDADVPESDEGVELSEATTEDVPGPESPPSPIGEVVSGDTLS